MKQFLSVISALALYALGAPGAAADDVAKALAFCKAEGDDNRIYAIPDRLLPDAARRLGVAVPEDGSLRGVWRCMDGKVMLCIPGGPRFCGRADTQVMPSPEARKYCHANPSAADVPSWATGRDTIFAWRCEGPEPIVAGPVRTVDKRGFVKEYWSVFEPEAAAPAPAPPAAGEGGAQR